MAYKCRVVADSISPSGARLTSIECRYPLFIHAEMLTHRQFSRSASSNRARGIKAIMREVIDDPVVPVWWGANEKGMVARRALSGWRLALARQAWRKGRYLAVGTAWVLDRLGLHKQLANRVMAPWQWITVLYTATEWENFFWLRCHDDAQPEMRMIAEMMRASHRLSVPTRREWHLPYVTEQEIEQLDILTCIKLAVARSARSSYGQAGGQGVEKDLQLYERLDAAIPPHSAPSEHVATANANPDSGFYNLTGWASWRWLVDRGFQRSMRLDGKVAA